MIQTEGAIGKTRTAEKRTSVPGTAITQLADQKSFWRFLPVRQLFTDDTGFGMLKIEWVIKVIAAIPVTAIFK